MIAKIKRNNSLAQTVEYNLKDQSNMIDVHNMVGEHLLDFMKVMELRQRKYSGNAEKKVAHIIISPSIKDGKKLNIEQWKDIGYRYLCRMGLDKHQSICFLHEDKGHIHLHIVSNRIDENGKIYRPRANEMIMSQHAGKAIAKELGLSVVKTLNEEEIITLGLYGQVRKDCAEAKALATNPDKTINTVNYFKILKQKGYGVKEFTGKSKGRTYGGYVVEKDGHFIKASKIGDEFTLQAFQKMIVTLTPSPGVKLKMEEVILTAAREVIAKHKTFIAEEFFKILVNQGYDLKVHFEKDKQGIDTSIARGYSLGMDGQLYRASDLGKEYTLSQLKKIVIERTPKQIKELEQMEIHLKELTSGHRYKDVDKFISALEEKGYKIHLRYSQGELVGYNIGIGRRHYRDDEIANGGFSLAKLLERKTIIKDNSNYDYPNRASQNDEVKDVDKILKDSFASEMKSILLNLQLKNDNVDAQEYLCELKKASFEIKEFFNKETVELRGYAVGKDGIFYNASEIGKEFTLGNLNKLKVGKSKDGNILSPLDKTIISNDLKACKQMASDRVSNTIDLAKYFEGLKNLNYELKFLYSKDQNGIETEVKRDYALRKLGTLHFHNSSEFGKEFLIASMNVGLMEELQKIKMKITGELKVLSKKTYEDKKGYFSELRKSGFHVTEFLNKEIGQREYALSKYGATFTSREIGKEFALAELTKTNFVGQPDKMEETFRQRL